MTDRIAQRRYRWRADPWLAPSRAELEQGFGTLRFNFEPRSAFTIEELKVSPWLELERVELVELIGGGGPVLLERLVPCDDADRSPDYAEARAGRWMWPMDPQPCIQPGQRLEVTCRLTQQLSSLQRCSALLEGTGLLPPLKSSAVSLLDHVSEPPPIARVVDDERGAFIRAVVALTTAQRALLTLELGSSSSTIEQDTATAVEQAERAWLVLQGKGYT